MGYRGKLVEQEEARRLRAAGLTMPEIAATMFCQPHRAVPDATVRHNKHLHGCATIRYSCTKTHRAVLGLVDALLTSAPPFLPG